MTTINGQIDVFGRRDLISRPIPLAFAQQIAHNATSKPVIADHTENSAVLANAALCGVSPTPTLATAIPKENPIAPSAVAASPLRFQSARIRAASPGRCLTCPPVSLPLATTAGGSSLILVGRDRTQPCGDVVNIYHTATYQTRTLLLSPSKRCRSEWRMSSREHAGKVDLRASPIRAAGKPAARIRQLVSPQAPWHRRGARPT